MKYVGVDPGIAGAISVLDEYTGDVEFYDAPTVTVKVGKSMKSQLDLMRVVLLLEGLGSDIIVTIEKQSPMPGLVKNKQTGAMERTTIGVTSSFNIGRGYGSWLGILAAMHLRYQEIAPLTWKRAMMQDMGKDKDASRIKCQQLFPRAAAKGLLRKKDHGRADALLIAEYARRTTSKTNMVEQGILDDTPLFPF